MSDIYLQITETPTVVTLSQPVIGSSVASTVTVANTVTVALDANSLSALENVTVTVGAAITGTVTVANFPSIQTIAGTVTANPTGTQTIAGTVTANVSNINLDGDGNLFVALQQGTNPYTQPISGTVTVSSLPAISGTVTANGIAFNEGEGAPDKAVWMAYNLNDSLQGVSNSAPLPISGTVTIGAGTAQIGSVTASISNFPASTVVCAYGLGTDGTWRGLEMVPGSNRLKVEAINSSGGSSFPISGTVTLGAGTAQIGSVTASISGTVPISISSVTVGNSVTIGSLPAISGTVTALLSPTNMLDVAEDIAQGFNNYGSILISGTVTANTFALQGTAVTTSNFTSTTASTVLANFNATREVLTIFNEGAGNLFVSVGATCTTIAYQVRLSAGDYYEVPNHQTTITHSAVFATAGTARVTEVS